MSFIVTDKPTFTVNVKVAIPDADGCRIETLKATYLALPEDELKDRDISGSENLTQFLRDIVIELGDMIDRAGNDVPWSEEAFQSVLKHPWSRRALWQTYFACLNGEREGN